MLPVEAMKYSANTVAAVGYQYEDYTGKLQVRCKAFQCDSTGEEK